MSEQEFMSMDLCQRQKLVYLGTFIKLIYRKSNIVCTGISSLLIVKTNNVAIL